MLRRFFLGAAALAAFGISHADAALTISKKPTKNVTCSAGVCAASRANAVLNAADLATMLAASDVRVSSGSSARDIDVTAAFAWASTHRLTLDSFRAIGVAAAVQVTGSGAMTITTNDGGSGGGLSFATKGHIEFLDTSSNLVIDGAPYMLAADLTTLAQNIFAHQAANHALARSYDASADGVYDTDPITTILLGNLEGLGNSIEHLRIDARTAGDHVGLIYGFDGALSDLRIVHESVKGGGANSAIGGVAGLCGGPMANVVVQAAVSGAVGAEVGGVCGSLDGTISNSRVSGSVVGKGTDTGGQSYAGGFAGSGGTIVNSSSTAKIKTGKGWQAGGLMGHGGIVQSSFATGSVLTGDNALAGGLIGYHVSGVISNAYATGFVGGGVNSIVGGLIGRNDSTVEDSYSSGPTVSGSGNAVGGFIGFDGGAADLTDTYFDITTSGQSHGVGNNTAYPGITGLTTEELQAGLPSGFDPQIWGEAPGINSGLPYLLANPQ